MKKVLYALAAMCLPFAALSDAAARVGDRQVRNRGTIGGNLGNASPIADWPPLLLCLDAHTLGKFLETEQAVLTAYFQKQVIITTPYFKM